MSTQQNDEWIEAVRECLYELTVDVHKFVKTLDGHTSADIIAKYGEYPPHYVAELLLDALHEKHVQSKISQGTYTQGGKHGYE